MEQKIFEEITEKFFKRRFPDKNIQFEKDCGYFWEWVERFKTLNPERFMDEKSLRVWKEMNPFLK